MHYKRFEELKATGLLPSPSGVGLEIVRLTRDEQASASDIARVIQADPALTGRTLRLANTGNAASGRPVTNIADAVARLGTRTVSAVALGFTILAGNRSGKCKSFDYQKFWSKSLAYAIATQILCAQTRKYAGPDGFTAGLLAQIGQLALASIHAEKYSNVLAEWAGGNQVDLIRMERKEFVTDHNELSSVMLADWGLPPGVCDAVLNQENPSAPELGEGSESRHLARVLYAASRIADVCVAPSEAHAAACAYDLLTRCEAVGMDSDTLFTLFDRVFQQWAEWGRMLEINTPKSIKLADLIEAGKSLDATALSVPSPPIVQSDFDADAKDAPNAETAVEASDPSYGLLVLVADQDASSLRFLEKFLVLSGHRVRGATGGREALQIFFETAPQLVIVDSALPEIGGLEFCRRLRQTTAGRQAYVIMLTPPDDEETLMRLFEAGVDDFVTKPFAARPLFARIRASLRVVGLQEKINVDREEIQRVHSELTVARRRLEQDALTDVLTGLPNRRYLIDRLAHDWAAARRSGTPLACMMVDIDTFKNINDTWGHDVGDTVLQCVARVLQREVRGADVVCRYGGEEFVVLSGTDFDSALRCAERLREAIEEQLTGHESPIKEKVTVSIGVAIRSEQTRSPEALLKAADEAMFCAKRNGRNRVASVRDPACSVPQIAVFQQTAPLAAEPLLDAKR